jgi:hypothetical protein
MIQLKDDCLLVQQPGGNYAPWNPSQLTLEFVGAAADSLTEETLQQVAKGVLYYFKEELGKTTVTLGEFAEALARALNGLGYSAEIAEISPPTPQTGEPAPRKIRTADLRELAYEAGKFGELEFFNRLRMKLRQQLEDPPPLVEFHGLRSCVKMLTGRKHWCQACEQLEEQILQLLRGWYGQEPTSSKTSLVVR